MANRLYSMGVQKYRNNFELTIHPDVLSDPYKWKRPRIIFVNSMSDLFHEDMPFEYIEKVFKVMNECSHHIFQVLTKRAENLAEFAPLLNWSKNIWMGVTVESKEYLPRIKLLQTINAHIKFLSIEPMLGSMQNLNLSGIDWVIVGGESGPGARDIKKEWVVDIKNQCELNDVAFFFKQWGGFNKKTRGRILNGKVWDQMPSLQKPVESLFA